MKTLIPLLMTVIIASCSNNADNKTAPVNKTDSSVVKKDTTVVSTQPTAADTIKKAKAWLISSIENEFSAAKRAGTDTSEKIIYTTQYNEYKNDAAGVDMDGGM